MWGVLTISGYGLTAAATATRADRGGLRRAGTPRAPRSQTPTSDPELRKQSLKTGATGPRGPETAFVCPSRELVADADTSESLRRLGCWQSSARVRSPQISTAQKPARGLPGGLVGAGYWGSSGRTLAAWGPFGPDVTSNSTAWPSSSER